jgi:hypothetical protein
MSYDKIKYWNNRAKPNSSNARAIADYHMEKVKPFIVKNSNILEYGPGIGRMIDLYKDQDYISFYDISSVYESELTRACENISLKINNFTIDKSGKIKTNFDNGQFDTLCAFEVLLHCPEDEIDEVINELSRISKEVIVITWYKGGESISSGHCSTRDYKKILLKNNLEIVHWDEDSFENQVFFIYENKNI